MTQFFVADCTTLPGKKGNRYRLGNCCPVISSHPCPIFPPRSDLFATQPTNTLIFQEDSLIRSLLSSLASPLLLVV